MIKKTLLVTAVGSLAIAGKMAPVVNTVDVQAPNSDATIRNGAAQGPTTTTSNAAAARNSRA